MITVVLDANVLASGVVGARRHTSTPGELLRRWRRGAYTLVLSEHILTEVERALADSYFRARLSTEDVAQFRTPVRKVRQIVPSAALIAGVATHPGDHLLLATAVSVQPSILVTGDRKLQQLSRFQDVTLLTPRAFLTQLEQQEHELRSEEGEE